MNGNNLYDLWEEVHNPPKLFFEDEVRDGFLVSTMMKRFWAAQLKVLAEIDKICKKHSLRWYADYGTLMGAIRHGGYIPWDDDMDICMLRDDYVQFIEYACEELPEGYEVMTLQKREDFEYSIGRINNTHFIDYTDEHLESHFGCPYLVGIDVFPLDGLMEDPDKEEERVIKLRDIATALLYIKEDMQDNDGFKKTIKKIEKDNNLTLKFDEGLKRRLMLLADDLYTLIPTKDAEYVGMMTHWASRMGGKYKKEWFDDIIYLPFEHVHLPVPAYYDKVLRTEYGNYMKIVKAGGAHDYPLYSGQEEILKEEFGENPYRYTMPDTVYKGKDRPSYIDRCVQITDMLSQVADKAMQFHTSGQYEVVNQLLTGSKTLADTLESVLCERERYIRENGPLLNKYAEEILRYGTVDHEHEGEECINSIKDKLDELIKSLEESYKRKEVLFLPVKIDWWPSMESEWRQAKDTDEYDVFVMPLLYLEKDFVRNNGEEKNDMKLFPEYVTLTTIEEYDIAKHHPDIVYIQDPYDGYNTMIAVPDYFHSKNLLNYTDELVYVPCYDVDNPESEDDKITSALRIIIEQPAVYYSDRVIVKSEELKKVYVDTLISITGDDSTEYWSSKVSVSTASYDDILYMNKFRRRSADKRSRILEHYGLDSFSDKCLLLMQINSAYLVQNGECAIGKISEAIDKIKARDNMTCLISLHESVDQLNQIPEYTDIMKQFRILLDEIDKDRNIIFDRDGIVTDADVDIADAYYGTAGAMAHKCMMNNTPTLFMAM